MPTPGFSTVLERSGRELSGKIVGIIVRCGTSALQLQTRGWHHFELNIPDGHQNGLIWGALGTLEAGECIAIVIVGGRRLCDPNGSV